MDLVPFSYAGSRSTCPGNDYLSDADGPSILCLEILLLWFSVLCTCLSVSCLAYLVLRTFVIPLPLIINGQKLLEHTNDLSEKDLSDDPSRVSTRITNLVMQYYPGFISLLDEEDFDKLMDLFTESGLTTWLIKAKGERVLYDRLGV
jgi:hypothetical protein